MKTYNIALLKGDGIGVEVVDEALKVLDSLPKNFALNYSEYFIGGAGYDAHGDPLPQSTLDGCKKSDAILFGAIGGAKWDTLEKHLRPESGLLRLRKKLGVYANVRPIKIYDALIDASPLKKERIQNSDFVIVRELISGIYFGEPRAKSENEAFNTMRYNRIEIERIARFAFDLAKKRNRQKKVTCVDKANVLETSVLWREVVSEVVRDYSDIELEFLYVDNASMQIILRPSAFDVILSENLFGDILSDEASVIGGSIGLLPSASIGEFPLNEFGENGAVKKIGLFEPIHGSAPDIAGQNIANPLATIISSAMMLEFLGEIDSAQKILKAVDSALNSGLRTKDLNPNDFILCSAMGDLVAKKVRENG
ncbi:3-isopropylmalate dehydrogenase [Helicobacter sp. 23-1045]